MRIEQHIEVAGTPDDVLAYVADFANLPAWDWSAARVERTAGDGLRVGSRYRVHLGAGPLTTALDYEVTRYVPGRCAQLLSDAGGVRSQDTIVVERSDRGTRLTYVAELRTGGLGDFLAPLVRPLFSLHGRIVMAHLRAELDARAGGATPWNRSA